MLREPLGSCSVHKVALQQEEVPIYYGLIMFSKDYINAREREFPNSYSFVLGGCLVSLTNPNTQRVSYCPLCREAERRWNEAHPPADHVYKNGWLRQSWLWSWNEARPRLTMSMPPFLSPSSHRAAEEEKRGEWLNRQRRAARPVSRDAEIRAQIERQYAEEQRQYAEEQSRRLAAALANDGLNCPHCHKQTKEMQFLDKGPWSYFICRLCSRSFDHEQYAMSERV